jgi:hypothetical protein
VEENRDALLQVPQGPPPGRGRALSCLSSILVLILGLFPWLDMRCDGRPTYTQNGYQIVLGRIS